MLRIGSKVYGVWNIKPTLTAIPFSAPIVYMLGVGEGGGKGGGSTYIRDFRFCRMTKLLTIIVFLIRPFVQQQQKKKKKGGKGTKKKK